jgi:hypothetical protein
MNATNTKRHYIDGNTYPIKEQLKALGCHWDSANKRWYSEDETIAVKGRAILQPTPIYNSPPPADLGTVDPIAMATKYGRTAVAGAVVKSFSVYGLAKGDNGKPDGSIRIVRGTRYVQVARTARQYYSCDTLEDFDMFNTEPGGGYQWDGVEVEPTADEAAKDHATTTAKAAKEAAPKAWNAAVKKIDQVVTEQPAWVSDTTIVARWNKPVMIHTGSYPVIHIGESEVYYYVPGYFACDWDYPAIHRTAPLTPELLAEITSAITTCRQHGLLS